MRTSSRLALLPVALTAMALAACGKASAPSDGAMSDDLKRDLQLASAASLDLASKQGAAAYPLTEVRANSAPAPTTVLKRGAGPKAVRSRTPTVKATPEPTAAPRARGSCRCDRL